jgi:hypothetical protein
LFLKLKEPCFTNKTTGLLLQVAKKCYLPKQ